MQSADYRQFCQLCQEGGVLDPLEICKTWLDRRNQRRLDELDEERSRAIGAQRERLGELLSLREPGDDPEALHTQVNAVQLALTLTLPPTLLVTLTLTLPPTLLLTLTLTTNSGQRGAARDARKATPNLNPLPLIPTPNLYPYPHPSPLPLPLTPTPNP